MLLTTELDKLSGTDWQLFFAQERAKPYFAELDAFVTAAAAEKTVYPAAENIFAAFRACPVSAVRVVILGQDPYHEPGQAMGLSFSVPDGCKAPPSLRNIFKELEAELGPGCAAHTDLTLWARQGVLLLNTVLTVEQGAANAHAGRGWETFTRAALEYAALLSDVVPKVRSCPMLVASRTVLLRGSPCSLVHCSVMSEPTTMMRSPRRTELAAFTAKARNALTPTHAVP